MTTNTSEMTTDGGATASELLDQASAGQHCRYITLNWG